MFHRIQLRCSVVACVVVALSALQSRPALAEPDRAAPEKSPARVFVEVDPATFVLRGYSLHVRVVPGGGSHYSLGAGVYGMDLPTPLVELDSKNRGEHWSSRIELAYGIFADRFFCKTGDGLFLGVEAGVQHFRVARDGVPGRARFENLVVLPRVGYLWRPFDAGFYVMPWAGIGATVKLGGTTDVSGSKYDVFPVVAFATLHVGWRF